jgi:hypothetical protein
MPRDLVFARARVPRTKRDLKKRVGVAQPQLCGEPALVDQPAEQVTSTDPIKVDDVSR